MITQRHRYPAQNDAEPTTERRDRHVDADVPPTRWPKEAYGRDGPNGLPSGVTVATGCRNVVVCTAASGGIGLSVFASIVARRLAEREWSCALIDADFSGGGLDVLLGVENESGIRFETLDAPLGRLDGEALNRELPVWDGVRVLASNPWHGKAPPDWWQTQAAVRALSEANRTVLIDAGAGDLLDSMPELAAAAQLVLVELSVLGLARAKRHIAEVEHRMASCDTPGSRSPDVHQTDVSSAHRSSSIRRKRSARPHARHAGQSNLLIIGAQPRGAARGADVVSLEEAADYLGRPLAARVRAEPRLCSDVLSGLGIRMVDRANGRVADEVCDWIDGLFVGGDAVCDP